MDWVDETQSIKVLVIRECRRHFLEVQGEKWLFRFQGAPGLHLSGIGKSDYGTLGLILWPWTVPFLNNEQLLEFLTILWYISASW